MRNDRSIDSAMRRLRPAKEVVRELWCATVATYNTRHPTGDIPLYLTLGGSEAHDIRMLIERDIIPRTETGAIAPDAQGRFVAIEKNSLAVFSLQEKYPGLKIIENDFKDLIRGETLIRFPEGQHEKSCRARIINLDFDTSLESNETIDSFFPVLLWIKKLCHLHIRDGCDWCLCLTLNGSINWPDSVCSSVQDFLRENFRRDQDFASACASMMGITLFNKIDDDTPADFRAMQSQERQKVLMVFVPKKIAHLINDQSWFLRTTQNLCYGGEPGEAPMVSWIMEFSREPNAAYTPDKVYRKCLREILVSARRIDRQGNIEALA